MTLSHISASGTGNHDPEELIPSIALLKSGDNLPDKLARAVARSLDIPSDGHADGLPVALELGVRLDQACVQEEGHVDVGLVVDPDEADDQLVYDFSHGWLPDALAAPSAPGATESRGRLRLYVLALAEPFLLVAVGIVLAVAMRTESTGEVGGKAPVLEADRAPGVKLEVPATAARLPVNPALATIDLLSKPDQPVGPLAAIGPTEPRHAATPAAPSMAVVAEDAPRVRPEPSAEAAISAAPDRVSTASIDSDPTVLSKGAPEAIPLPPTRPLTLVDQTSRTSQQFRPATGGAPSFAIQLAASRSMSDAVATLSRLKQRYPEMLAGGSVRRADKGNSGIFYRVQAGPLPRDAANRACAWLKEKGEDCIVVR